MLQRRFGVCAFVLALLAVAFSQMLPDSRAQARKGKKYALLVGVNEYQHPDLPSLRYAENDVTDLARALRGGGFEVRLLSGAEGKKDEKNLPTAKNIREGVAWLLEERSKFDTVLIALSGHGIQLEVADPDEKGDNRTYPYFCPSDADFLRVSYKTGNSKRLINLNTLFEDLGKCLARPRLVLVDACRNELKVKGSTRSADPSKVNVPENVSALFSCARGQKAWEAEEFKHGVFFHFVLEGLEGNAKNEDGEVTWARLNEYVQKQVSRNVGKIIGGGVRQTPHLVGSLVGESPVILKPDAAKPVEPILPKPNGKAIACKTFPDVARELNKLKYVHRQGARWQGKAPPPEYQGSRVRNNGRIFGRKIARKSRVIPMTIAPLAAAVTVRYTK